MQYPCYTYASNQFPNLQSVRIAYAHCNFTGYFGEVKGVTAVKPVVDVLCLTWSQKRCLERWVDVSSNGLYRFAYEFMRGRRYIIDDMAFSYFLTTAQLHT